MGLIFVQDQLCYLAFMGLKHAYRLLKLSQKIADTKVDFDEFVYEVAQNHKDLEEATKKLGKLRSVLQRSNYTDLVAKVDEVTAGLEKGMELAHTFLKMYSSGKLSYGPRTPKNVIWGPFSEKTKKMHRSQESPSSREKIKLP